MDDDAPYEIRLKDIRFLADMLSSIFRVNISSSDYEILSVVFVDDELLCRVNIHSSVNNVINAINLH